MIKEKDMANRAIVFFVFLSVLLLLFPSSKVAHTVRVIASYSLYPSLHTGAKAEYFARNVPENFMSLVRSASENVALKDKVRELEVYRRSADSLFAENARLTALLGLSHRMPWKGMWARVVSRDPVNWHSSFYIGKGSRDGVEVNDPVLGFEDGRESLAGRVCEVFPDYSKVLLLTDAASSVVASPLKGGFDALAEGKGDGTLRLNYVCETCALEPGTEIVTSPGGMFYPGGIRLGSVVRVHPKESFMNFITADLATAVSLSGLREVFVLRRDLPAKLRGQAEAGAK